MKQRQTPNPSTAKNRYSWFCISGSQIRNGFPGHRAQANTVASVTSSAKPPKQSNNTPTVKQWEHFLMPSIVSRRIGHGMAGGQEVAGVAARPLTIAHGCGGDFRSSGLV